MRAFPLCTSKTFRKKKKTFCLACFDFDWIICCTCTDMNTFLHSLSYRPGAVYPLFKSGSKKWAGTYFLSPPQLNLNARTRMLRVTSLSTLDWRKREHKHARGLKWTLQPLPCSPAEPWGPAPGKEAKTATCIWNSRSHTQYACKCLCVWECVHIWKRHCSTLHMSGSVPTKDMGLNERIHTSTCVLLLSVLLCSFRTEISINLYAIKDCIQCTNTLFSPCGLQ